MLSDIKSIYKYIFPFSFDAGNFQIDSCRVSSQLHLDTSTYSEVGNDRQNYLKQRKKIVKYLVSHRIIR